MTPAEFEQLLRRRLMSFMFTAADGMRLAEAVAGLAESERKKLSKTAVSKYRAARKAPWSNDWEFAALAVLAAGPLSEARKVEVRFFQRQEEAAAKILIDRRPEWLDEWVTAKLSAEHPEISWELLRAIIRAGACKKPNSRGYAVLVSHGLGFRAAIGTGARVTQQLLNDPDLIKDIWLFFQHDTYAFHPDVGLWTEAVCELAAEGRLDRQRLLDSALEALDNDFPSITLAGYIHLYEALKPTQDERASRQSRYLELLSHRVPQVVTFALDQLKELDKEDTLSVAEFLASSKSVFAIKPKGPCDQALKLVAQVVNRHPQHLPTAINTVVEALRHESADIQSKAVAMLDGWQTHLHRDHVSEIRDRLDGLAATVRPKAQAIVDRGSPAREQPAMESAETTPPKTAAADLPRRAAGIDTKWRALAGIDNAIQAAAEGRLPPALSFDMLDVPILSATEPIEPIQTVDELLDAVARALEVLETADELERVLDGISRLCDQRPPDFELRAAPLIKRMTDEKAAYSGQGLLNRMLANLSLHKLLYAWLTRHPLQQPSSRFGWGAMGRHNGLARFIDLRLEEIERRVFLQQPAPLLAAPTHRFGWIDARQFASRIEQVLSAVDKLPNADFVQSLLRLAPDGRHQALAEARDIPGLIGRAVRWALGGSEGPTAADRESVDIWLAAARCRKPTGPLDELASLAPVQGAELLLSARTYNWSPHPPEVREFRHIPGGAVDLQITLQPSNVSPATSQMRPTIAWCESPQYGWFYGSAWTKSWRAMIWPANCESYLAEAAIALANRVNAPASTLEPNHAYFAALLESDRPWSELAYLVTWVALVSKDPDSCGAAADAMITAIEDGRAATDQAADVLSRLLPGGWVKLNRVADSCREIARVSPLHAWWIAEMLQAFLTGLVELPKDAHHLLSLLLELLTELRLAISPTTRDWLSARKTTGKAAKVVKELLGLASAGISDKAQAAIQHAIKSRFARAEKWSAAQTKSLTPPAASLAPIARQ